MKIASINWKQNVPTKGIDAERAYSALEAIRRRNGGLTDDAIVEASRPKNHALHKWFEWDNEAAAIEYRRDQARLLMRAIEVTYEEAPEIKTRVYEIQHKTRPGAEQRTVYTTTEEVLSNPESRDRLIASAIAEAMRFRRRFGKLHELDRIIAAIDEAIVKLGSEAVTEG